MWRGERWYVEGKIYGDGINKRDGNMLRGKKKCGKEICVEKNAENM